MATTVSTGAGRQQASGGAPTQPVDRAPTTQPARPVRPHGADRWTLALGASLLGALVLGVLVGPAALPWRGVVSEVASHLPLLDVRSTLTQGEQAIFWQIRVPRVVLGALVGAMLAAGGAAYQGVFRNPLADPYLLGVAAGAGLGATVALAYGPATDGWVVSPLPVFAFAGGLLAVAVTWLVSTTAERGRTTTSLVLAGVAIASFFTALQTFVQDRNTDEIRRVYSWILGQLNSSGWDDVVLVLPYVTVCCALLLLARRHLDVLRVGEEEAEALGAPVRRVRLIVVVAATLGTAAVVAVSGLIGFVGVIVPHTVRLLVGGSYRRVLPLSIVLGASFLVLADLLGRSLASPAEIPIGVVTAFFGAPFFVLVLRSRSRA